MKYSDIQEELNRIKEQLNLTGVDDFLGLSPDQMHTFLYGRSEDIDPILNFSSAFDPNLLETVPVINKARLLIQFIGESGEVKATQNGFLPKKIVNALYDFPPFDYKFTIQTEEYVPTILALRRVITDCGWIKIRNRKFSLTKKGKLIFEKGFTALDYVKLLKYWIKNYNWSFTDGYPECPIVQQAAFFLFYILYKKANEFYPTDKFAALFIRAFPMALETLPEEECFPTPPEEIITNLIRLRFLERFALYFGLIEFIEYEDLPFLERKKSSQVKTTKLFDAVFVWFSDNVDLNPNK